MNAKAHMYTDNGLCDEELEGLTGKTITNQTIIF